MYIDIKMVEGGFQLQRAAADVLPSRLYRDRCLLIEQLRWLVSDASSDADFPGQDGATRLLTAREQSAPDEQLIKPYLFGHVCSSGRSFSRQKVFSEVKVINRSSHLQ